jgi:D-alanine--poly(phosphoribitol) ligase subunit 1
VPKVRSTLLPEESCIVRNTSGSAKGNASKPQLTHERFESWANTHPDRVAIVCGDVSLTYDELNDRANRLARHLNKLGVCQGSAVGICFAPRIETMVCILASLKAGAAYAPIDSSYPADRLALVVTQLDNMNFIFVSEQTDDKLKESGKQLIPIGKLGQLTSYYPADNLQSAVRDDELCYVVFTSGTTGTPKAVGIQHGGWANLLAWIESDYHQDEQSTGLLVSAFGFDISQRALMTPLYVGATLCLLDTEYFDPRLAVQMIQKHRVRSLHLAPSTVYLLTAASAGNETLASLEHMFIGGDALSVGRIKQWALNEGERCCIVHQYGVAECTDVATSYVVERGRDYGQSGIPMGAPVANCEVHVLNDAGHEVGVGETGEVFISGAGVGIGYVNNPQLTAERFVRTSVRGREVHAYRSGDFARRMTSSEYVCLGRRDSQIKIRGMLTNLTDIEHVIKRSIPAIAEAIVLALGNEGESGQSIKLVAFVMFASGGALDASDLKRQLTKQLPRHMIPLEFVSVEQFPLTQNGKVDRQLLKLQLESAGAES